MTRAGKLGLIAGALVLFVVAGWALAISAVSAMGGVMTVHVLDRHGDVDVYLPVPMALLDLAALSVGSPAVGTAGVGHLRVDGVGVDVGELGPTLVGMLEELDRLPDVTLVEVVSGHDLVRVAKRGGKLVVEIDEPETALSVSVPTRAAARLADRLLD